MVRPEKMITPRKKTEGIFGREDAVTQDLL